MNLRRLRETLLEQNAIKEYCDIQDFLQNPYKGLLEETRTKLLSLEQENFEKEIIDWFRSDNLDYRNKIIFGQLIIWQEVNIAYTELLRVEKQLKETILVFYEENYLKSTEQISMILNLYSNAKAAITRLEINLGVDRYLDNLSTKDFELLVKKFDEIHKGVEMLLAEYKILYVKKWNTANIYNLIIHKMIRKNLDNQVCTLIQGKKKRVLLFVVDGFGMGQYFWSKKVVPQNNNLTYSNNVFEWLSRENLIDELILGAPLITDTAAGISQIFIGKTAKDTRIFSSSVKKEGDNRMIPVKNLNQSDFLRIADTGFNSFTVDVLSEKDFMRIYYCSKYDMEHVSGFSKFVFDSADVKSIVPSERVFSFLKEDICEEKEGVTVVYITNIDNSGHVMGSFSQFERYEHEKINMLFKNFLIEAAQNNPEIFNGETSILVTADHGMTESYRINISKNEILDVFKIHHEHPRIIEANRAELIYGVSHSKINGCKAALKQFLEEKGVQALVLSREDDLFDSFIPRTEWAFIDTSPDIIILLISEGIFYSKDVGENLMHFGGHGGHSIDEVFVPLLNIELNQNLRDKIEKRFLNLE